MSADSTARRLALALGLSLAAAQAGAATLTEAAAPGGAFSAAWDHPTEIGAGFDTVTGTGSQNAYDNLLFTALPAGRAEADAHLLRPRGHRLFLLGGRRRLLQRHAVQDRVGLVAASPGRFQVGYWNPQQTIDLDLADSFSGKLYLALNFTHGAEPRLRHLRPVERAAGRRRRRAGAAAGRVAADRQRGRRPRRRRRPSAPRRLAGGKPDFTVSAPGRGVGMVGPRSTSECAQRGSDREGSSSHVVLRNRRGGLGHGCDGVGQVRQRWRWHSAGPDTNQAEPRQPPR